jgi:hypothetical protein
MTALEEASKNADRCFRFSDASDEQRERFRFSVRKRPSASQCFIAPTIFSDDREPRHIVVFCDTPTYETAKHWFSSPELKHAVAYSDGGVALISTADFAALDRSHFLPVSNDDQR